MSLLLIDMDGTLREPLSGQQYFQHPKDQRIYDFDLFENNEAFALSSVLFNRVLGVPYEKLNVYGGAIALGHPIGASGARIIVTLLNALQERNGQLGLASVCHGTGGGTAIAIERL
ncbi:MAG TPA: hypothetical protein V6D48_13150 [Oculatellaceae cyanobacterium]